VYFFYHEVCYYDNRLFLMYKIKCISHFKFVLWNVESGYSIYKFISGTPIINDALHPNISRLFLSIVHGSQLAFARKGFSKDEICIKDVIREFFLKKN